MEGKPSAYRSQKKPVAASQPMVAATNKAKVHFTTNIDPAGLPTYSLPTYTSYTLYAALNAGNTNRCNDEH
jgi:hypothetical protein